VIFAISTPFPNLHVWSGMFNYSRNQKYNLDKAF
jgi:hypothetical protein